MGHQSYVIPFDSDAELNTILDIIREHNSQDSGYTDEYVRYGEGESYEYKQLEVGEELGNAVVFDFKTNKAYRCPRQGPALSRVLMVGHGGGRNCTFAFFKWHLMRAFPDKYVDGYHAVDAYSYHDSMRLRLAVKTERRIPDARINPLPNEAAEVEDMVVRPAKWSTRHSGGVSAAWTALMDGADSSHERKRRRAENRHVSPYTNEYTTFVKGFFVEGHHFDDKQMAEEWAERERRRTPIDLQGSINDVRRNEAKRNLARFFKMRALGKSYWKRGSGGLFWLDEDELMVRRADGETFESAMIDYEPEGYEYGRPCKKASIDEIESMINSGEAIQLRNV